MSPIPTEESARRHEILLTNMQRNPPTTAPVRWEVGGGAWPTAPHVRTYSADDMPPSLPLEKENNEGDDSKDYVDLVNLEQGHKMATVKQEDNVPCSRLS
jgi:hypothetical protein